MKGFQLAECVACTWKEEKVSEKAVKEMEMEMGGGNWQSALR